MYPPSHPLHLCSSLPLSTLDLLSLSRPSAQPQGSLLWLCGGKHVLPKDADRGSALCLPGTMTSILHVSTHLTHTTQEADADINSTFQMRTLRPKLFCPLQRCVRCHVLGKAGTPARAAWIWPGALRMRALASGESGGTCMLCNLRKFIS